MKILIACEYSGTVRDAFIERGHDAISCDLLPSDKPGPHYQGDVFDIINDGFDLMIAHPPCTYLSVSGLHWNGRVPGRSEKTEDALRFVQRLMDANIPKIVVENPISCISSRIRKPDQIIQPYNFGHDASKSTCLWLKGVKELKHTVFVYPRIVNGKQRWGNQTDSGQNKLAPSADRWKIRSTTYQGIADAMAMQWGKCEYVIYSISNPITGNIMYVGLTCDIKERTKTHMSGNHNIELANEIELIRSFGLMPIFNTLELCNPVDAADKEWYWIDRMIKEGHDLHNRNSRSDFKYIKNKP